VRVEEGQHRFVEHTSEVELHLRAHSLSGLFVQAGHAVAELMLGEGERAPESVVERVVVTAPDREALLAAWIDELVFQSERHKAVFIRFTVERVADGEIAAELRGIAEPVIKTAVKAATFFNLRVAEDGGHYLATVVLDV
jgi:SHS2 domain-containing protein